MAKFGIALGSGPRGLGFESRHSDQKYELSLQVELIFFIETGTVAKQRSLSRQYVQRTDGRPDTPTTKKHSTAGAMLFS